MLSGWNRRVWMQSLACVSLAARAEPRAGRSTPAVLRLATGTEADSEDGRQLREVYRAALGALGYGLQVVEMPPLRSAASLETGQLDGEMLRSDNYIRRHPLAFKVDFPLSTASLSVYGRTPLPPGMCLDSAVTGARAVAYRRGVTSCEQRLAALVPPQHRVEVNTTRSGAAMVMAGRVDLLCEFDGSIRQWRQQAEPHQAQALHRLGALIPELPLFLCLHLRHAALGAPLAVALRALERSGHLRGLAARPLPV